MVHGLEHLVFFNLCQVQLKLCIDYNKDNYIDLKNNEDAYASAANYLKKIGWKKNEPCFYKIDLKKDIPKKYLNVSAKKFIEKKIKFFKKYIKYYSDFR